MTPDPRASTNVRNGLGSPAGAVVQLQPRSIGLVKRRRQNVMMMAVASKMPAVTIKISTRSKRGR